MPGSEVVLALVTAMLAVLATLIPAAFKAWNYRSNTYIRVLGLTEDAQAILVAVGNDGDRPAVVRSLRMTFSGIALEPVESVKILNPEKQLVLPGSTAVLNITALDLKRQNKISFDNLALTLKNGHIIVKATVIETSRTGDHYVHPEDDRVVDVAPGEWIRAIAQEHSH